MPLLPGQAGEFGFFFKVYQGNKGPPLSQNYLKVLKLGQAAMLLTF